MIRTDRVPPPYLRRFRTANAIMGDVCIALCPCIVSAVWVFGVAAAVRIWIAVVASLTAARLSAKTAPDWAAVVTGLILCLSCPVGVPLWLLIGGCFFAVCVIRDGFGGIGNNLFNPAMAARGVLLLGFPQWMNGYSADGVASATPLVDRSTPLWALVTGRIGGSMGETSVLMIAIGFAWLCIRRVIAVRIPLLSLLGFTAVIGIAGEPIVYHLVSGGLLFGAVFVFTDYTTKPIIRVGEVIFALGVGVLTALMRVFGIYPEGVCFAVLCMNLIATAIRKERVTI